MGFQTFMATNQRLKSFGFTDYVRVPAVLPVGGPGYAVKGITGGWFTDGIVWSTFPTNSLMAWEVWVADSDTGGTDRTVIWMASRIWSYRRGNGYFQFKVFFSDGTDTGWLACWLTNNTSKHHLVIQFDGTNLKIYEDAVQKYSASTWAGKTLRTPTSLTLSYCENCFLGTWDNFRIFNKGLSNTEIATLYSEGNGLYGADPLGDSSCVMYCPMDEGTGVTVYDIRDSYNATFRGNMQWVTGFVPIPGKVDINPGNKISAVYVVSPSPVINVTTTVTSTFNNYYKMRLRVKPPKPMQWYTFDTRIPVSITIPFANVRNPLGSLIGLPKGRYEFAVDIIDKLGNYSDKFGHGFCIV
jgi:hypothetical protein